MEGNLRTILPIKSHCPWQRKETYPEFWVMLVLNFILISAVALAEQKNYHGLTALRNEHMKWLLATQQEEKAAEIKEKNGDVMAALNLYLKAGLSVHAAR